MRGPRVRAWERKLKRVFDRIDDTLEERYGRLYKRHPNRPPRGTTANKESDGLFNVGASFSAGFGSELGRGYVVNVRMATLARVSPEDQKRIEDTVAERLKEELPKAFPGRELHVDRDGPVYKIYGDLSLSKEGAAQGW
jgi:hypothetical protein